MDTWNRRVDSFHVERIAEQVREIGADYVFLTVGQATGIYCSPNQVYEDMTGLKLCSERDLISDFADALARYRIPLLVYSQSHLFSRDLRILEKLECIPPWRPGEIKQYDKVRHLAGTDPRLKNFLRKWCAIHREWSLRWGKKVHGWWIDSAYHSDQIYHFPDEPNGHTCANALKAGNSDSIVAFNPGVYLPRENYADSAEDYTAGELDNPEYWLPKGRMTGKLRSHMLSFVGRNWCTLPLRYSAEDISEITRKITDNGGVATWDLPYQPDGIFPEVFKTMKEFGKRYRKSFKQFPETFVEIVPPEILPDGEKKSGKLILHPSKETVFAVGYNGKTVLSRVSLHGETELEALPDQTDLVLESSGIRRTFPITAKRFLKLSDVPSGEFILRDDNDMEFAGYTFAADGNVLLIRARILEKEPETVPEAPWKGSCLEVFLYDGEHDTHYCITPDTQCRNVDLSSALNRVQNVSVQKTEETEGQYELHCRIPLKNANSFSLSQTVKRNGSLFQKNLFSSKVRLPESFAGIEKADESRL